jgi:hypothetical protein
LVPDGIEKELPDAVQQVRDREGKLLEFVRSDSFSLDGFRDHAVE